MPADPAAEILDAEQRCREAGAAFAAAVNRRAPQAEVDGLMNELLRLAETVVAMKGEAIPGDYHRPQPAPPPPAPAPAARIVSKPIEPGPTPIKPPDLFG